VTTRLKIVPKSSPNDDGKWIEVERNAPATSSGRWWGDIADHFNDVVPNGYFLVDYETVTDK
jgi:hypothetical protein